ncbi:MAG: hypothetical protein M3063_07925 [Actinomycetota bacterium]|nr:hypothetical protein [Actinomycetota bacterium]
MGGSEHQGQLHQGQHRLNSHRARGALPARARAALTTMPVEADAERRLEIPAALALLLPHGGPRRGTTVGIGVGPVPGEVTLALSLVSAASHAGRWVSIVGLPAMGPVAAAQLGVQLERLVLVPQPAEQWAVVTAALLESMDVVVLRPPGRVRPADARRLVARTREREAVLVVLGGGWPEGVDLRLTVTRAAWEGLEGGHGLLRARKAEVAVSGRRAGGGDRRGWLWLPGPDGKVGSSEPAEPADPAGSVIPVMIPAPAPAMIPEAVG